jgi:hypothetical protein
MTDEEWGRLPGAVTKHYGPCPGCELRRAGSLHRGSARLWQGRAGRARENDGTDPVSDVTLDDAERHLAAIGDEEGK